MRADESIVRTAAMLDTRGGFSSPNKSSVSDPNQAHKHIEVLQSRDPNTFMCPIGRIPKRNYVHCLRCYKPQDRISVHLMRGCMKDSTPEEIAVEVRTAKASTKRWVRYGRTWDYNDLVNDIPHGPGRIAFLKKLVQRGFFILNRPLESDMLLTEPDTNSNTSAAATNVGVASATHTIAATSSSASVDPQGSPPSESPSSSDQDVGIRDPSSKKPLPTPTTSVRIKMKEAGLYDKFSDDTVLLLGFKKYLSETLGVHNYQQEVDNVSRFLRYLQPTGDELRMDFLSKSQQSQEYLSSLRRTEMSAATVLNYLKNMIRFVDYLKSRLDLTTADKDLCDNLQAFKEFLQTMKKPVSKSYSKDVCKTRSRNEWLMEGTRSVRDCQKILRVAKHDMLLIFGKFDNLEVSESEKTTYRYFCEALLVLKHFQRPGAVEGMTTKEWVNRKHKNARVVISISQHKTATMQVARFALTQEEEAWFQAYYEHIRPGYLRSEIDNFFISSTGKPVYSVTNDIGRLHEIYHVKPANSQEVRRAVETEAALLFTETQTQNVSHYLAHCTAVAEQHDRMWADESIVQTATLLDTLGRFSSPNESSDSHPDQARKHVERNFSEFTRSFPVTKHGQPPSKKARVQAGFSEDRVHYDKWRTCQYAERQRYLLSHFSARKPTVGKVQRFLKKEGWMVNCPSAEDIVRMSTPAHKFSIETDPNIIRCVSHQKWTGLVIKDFGSERGLGVVAAKPFSKGDIVCDYHGKVITAAEGRAKINDPNIQSAYFFFFKSGQKDLCVDAESSSCECHPGNDPFGRRINHSSKRANIKPLHCVLKDNGEDKHVILFRAIKEIPVDAELLFDYGVNRKSFKGEGLDLEWLDS